MGTLSMSTKIAILSVAMVVIALVITVVINKEEYANRISDLVRNDMIAVATSYGQSFRKADSFRRSSFMILWAMRSFQTTAMVIFTLYLRTEPCCIIRHPRKSESR